MAAAPCGSNEMNAGLQPASRCNFFNSLSAFALSRNRRRSMACARWTQRQNAKAQPNMQIAPQQLLYHLEQQRNEAQIEASASLTQGCSSNDSVRCIQTLSSRPNERIALGNGPNTLDDERCLCSRLYTQI